MTWLLQLLISTGHDSNHDETGHSTAGKFLWTIFEDCGNEKFSGGLSLGIFSSYDFLGTKIFSDFESKIPKYKIQVLDQNEHSTADRKNSHSILVSRIPVKLFELNFYMSQMGQKFSKFLNRKTLFRSK